MSSPQDHQNFNNFTRLNIYKTKADPILISVNTLSDTRNCNNDLKLRLIIESQNVPDFSSALAFVAMPNNQEESR